MFIPQFILVTILSYPFERSIVIHHFILTYPYLYPFLSWFIFCSLYFSWLFIRTYPFFSSFLSWFLSVLILSYPLIYPHISISLSFFILSSLYFSWFLSFLILSSPPSYPDFYPYLSFLILLDIPSRFPAVPACCCVHRDWPCSSQQEIHS